MIVYLREAYLLPVIVCVPLVAVLLLMKRWFVPHDYLQLGVHLGVAAVVYGLALGWAFASKRAMNIGHLQFPEAALVQPAAGAAAENYSQEI
jgi:hypothetical protein